MQTTVGCLACFLSVLMFIEDKRPGHPLSLTKSEYDFFCGNHLGRGDNISPSALYSQPMSVGLRSLNSQDNARRDISMFQCHLGNQATFCLVSMVI